MSNQSQVIEAGEVLTKALTERDPEVQRAALDVVLQLLTLVFALSPREMLEAVAKTESESGQRKFNGAASVVCALTTGLKEKIHSRFHVLLRLLQTSWICGDEGFHTTAPPFADVKGELMATLDCGLIDFEGFAAVLVGRYGPEAHEVLPDLVDRLRLYRTDCSKAPGLTWAVYQIGGVSTLVREVLVEVARGKDSCPHSRPIAQKILTMNEISWE